MHGLFTALQERGHQIKIVSRVNAKDFWRDRVPARLLVTEAIRVRNEVQRFSPDAWLVYGASASAPDLFGWWQRPKGYVLIAATTSKSKHVPKAWRWLFRQTHRRSLARADKVTAYDPNAADRLRSFGVAEDRLRLVPLAIKCWESVPSLEESRQRLGLPQDALVILCVSRLTKLGSGQGKTEAVLNLLAAVARLPADVTLVLVGDGPGHQRVEEELAKLKLEGRVRFVGAVEHDEVKWYYAACDFFAYPHLHDLPWLAILEAQSCGRPVVTMHTRSAELTVDAGRTGLLAKDLEEFQSHMVALTSDRDRRKVMGEAGPEYIDRHHSIEVRAKQIEEMLLGGR